jgi:SAM-dependent methyltransferase
MKRKIEVGLFLFILVLGAAAVLFFRGESPAPSRESILVDSRHTLPAPDEITIRNVVDVPVRYETVPYGSTSAPEVRTLLTGNLDRHRTKDLLVISFERAGRTITRSLTPGRAYSFRYDEYDLLEIWIGSHGREDADDLAPFVATPRVVVDRMLEMAMVGPDDIVYDIGCGDGRIVIKAAEKFGARGVGIDIDPERIRESRENAAKAMVEHLVTFLLEDATRTDISKATIVTLYLLPESNGLLRPKLEKELQPGTLVVSHNYTIPGWEAKEVRYEKIKDGLNKEHTIYLYKR